METTTSALVKSIDRELDEELPRAVANMRSVQTQDFSYRADDGDSPRFSSPHSSAGP